MNIHAKNADLAGTWYSDDRELLRAELSSYIESAKVPFYDGKPLGFIAPHAGYRYSGPVAAYTYKEISKISPKVVIVVGFSHRKYFPGIAVFTGKEFVTPLGVSEIDITLSKKLIEHDPSIQDNPDLFNGENSVEMQIPFIQESVKGCKLVLIAIGEQSIGNINILSDALYENLKTMDDFIIVGSTDMSHYLTYDNSVKVDSITVNAIKKFDPQDVYVKNIENNYSLMCGAASTAVTMDVCKRLGANNVQILKYANSGDTTGDKSRVVGYLSAAFVKNESKNTFNDVQRVELLKIARDSIKYYLQNGENIDISTNDELLKKDFGAFVTLRKDGKLRGCIGRIVADGPLYLTVRDMAVSASVSDMRFKPVKLKELDDIHIEISVLSPLERIYDPNKIILGRDGVLVRSGGRSGVFLPQVADETGWDLEEFMNNLCATKAGIPYDAWKTGKCEIYIYRAEVFEEER